MKPWMKWVLGIIAGLIILVIIVLLVVISIINPNDYKGRIEAAVHDKTGLYLDIGGKIKWQLFPSIGLTVSNINVENQKKQPLAKLQQAEFSVKLLPLIFKKVEMRKIVVNGVDLNIVKQSDGRFNWQQNAISHKAGVLSSGKVNNLKNTELKALSVPEKSTHRSSALSLNIQKVELKNINLHYQDKASHQNITVNNAYVTAGNILSGSAFPVSAGFTIDSKNPSLNMAITLSGNGLVNLKKQTYALSDMNLKTTPLQASAKGDSFTLKGDASVVDKAIKFNLSGSQLNLQNYLPVVSENKGSSHDREKSSNTSAVTRGNPEKISAKAGNTGEKVIIPVAPLHVLNIDGKLALSGLTFNQLYFNHPEIAIKAKNGIAEISKLKAGFYGGTIDAKAVVNTRHTLPDVSMKASITNTNLQQLGQALKNVSNIHGNVNANMRLLSRGVNQSELTRNLNGVVSFNIDQGQIVGVNVNHLVCLMISTIRNKKIEKTDWSNATQFTALKGEWKIHDGVARNNDLTASLNQMNLRGDGWVNMVTQMMDYHLGLTVTGSSAEPGESACEINPKYADISWPVRCKGKIGEKGLCGIDKERLGNTTKEVLQREAREQLQKQLKKHLGDDIGNKLKGLFN